ncbi:carboxypeptidase-like regulatory domain-containing protein [Niabella sp. W65]|nr:carboxypeptidase-like regulatory domain-containing protein [Niabella sp. W65]MCH7366669.1 carboxypeptidase-like regulatory domain-containing protein [Niabella sp. W65]
MFAQTPVTGKVTNEKQEPLGGVSVGIKGATSATVTDQEGNYTITATPEQILVFSSVVLQKRLQWAMRKPSMYN